MIVKFVYDNFQLVYDTLQIRFDNFRWIYILFFT